VLGWFPYTVREPQLHDRLVAWSAVYLSRHAFGRITHAGRGQCPDFLRAFTAAAKFL
jgi:hypothetical protein